MNEIVNLEKLSGLKDKGVISEEEFAEQKRIIFAKSLRESGERSNPKSGIVYILLAWFLGAIGLHNFYAGFVGRGLTQLFLTLLSPLFLFVPLIMTALWAFVELMLKNKDRSGRRFRGNRKVILLLRIIAFVWLAIAIYSATTVKFDLPIELPSEADFVVDE